MFVRVDKCYWPSQYIHSEFLSYSPERNFLFEMFTHLSHFLNKVVSIQSWDFELWEVSKLRNFNLWVFCIEASKYAFEMSIFEYFVSKLQILRLRNYTHIFTTSILKGWRYKANIPKATSSRLQSHSCSRWRSRLRASRVTSSTRATTTAIAYAYACLNVHKIADSSQLHAKVPEILINDTYFPRRSARVMPVL